MAITFNPSTLDFGNVASGSSVSQTVTVTSDVSDPPVTLALSGSGFSTSSSLALPAGGSIVVTVTFTPSQESTYPGTISVSGSSEGGLSITGTGVDPDQYESAQAGGAGTDAVRAVKYYQVAVPGFALNGNTSKPGNSFMRLGSFPSYTPNGSTATSADPTPGFQASLDLAFDWLQSVEATDQAWDSANISDDTRTLTQGGVWEHTDGNRVVTTSGDKLEVIQGNYNFHVIGGPTDPVSSTVSGPCVSTLTGTPDQPIGPDTPSATPPIAPASMPKTADLTPGDVFSGTWASRILTYQGSADQTIGVVYSETYADAMTTNTFVMNGGACTTNTSAGAITTAQTAAAITNTNTALLTSNATFGVQNNLNVGAVFNTTFGAIANSNFGAIANINLGIQTNINLPEKLQFEGMTTVIEAEEAKLAGVTAAIATMSTFVTQNSTAIAASQTRLDAFKNTMAETATHLGGDCFYLCGMIGVGL